MSAVRAADFDDKHARIAVSNSLATAGCFDFIAVFHVLASAFWANCRIVSVAFSFVHCFHLLSFGDAHIVAGLAGRFGDVYQYE